jgi:hypothetical protein
MPIGTRSATLLPRNYLHDPYLNSIAAAPNAREVFMRMKLLADNQGRLPGNPAVLGNYLFPSLPVKPLAMSRFIAELSKFDLIFCYKRGKELFIEIADNGETQKLQGHMTENSDFPPPPADLIQRWEERTGRKWKRISRSSGKESIPSTDAVHTTFAPSTDMIGTASRPRNEHVSLKRSEVKGSEAKRGEEMFDGATPAPPVSTSVTEAKSLTENSFKALMQGDPHSLAKRLKVFTGERFEPALMREYEFTTDFYEIFNEACKRNEDLPATRANVIHVMAEVMNEGKSKALGMPKGWYPVLKALREEEKSA